MEEQFDPRFPIGKFKAPKNRNNKDLEKWISIIAEFSELLANRVNSLSIEQLNFTYRKNSWTIAQIIHHLADSHINSFIRFKLSLTETNPAIKPYDEAEWAKLADGKEINISPSLNILSGVHHRWHVLLNDMKYEDYDKCFIHPEYNRKMSLYYALALYSWHCEHHFAHINLALSS